MSAIREVFVIVHDGGYEGYSGPIQAFETLEEAKAGHRLMSQVESYHIFRVPIWPITNAESYVFLRPVWPEKA